MFTLSQLLSLLARYPLLLAIALKLLALGDRLDWLVIWHRARTSHDDDAA